MIYEYAYVGVYGEMLSKEGIPSAFTGGPLEGQPNVWLHDKFSKTNHMTV